MEPFTGVTSAATITPSASPGKSAKRTSDPRAGFARDAFAAVAAGAGYLLFQRIVFSANMTNAVLLDVLSVVSLLITIVFTISAARALRSPCSQVASLAASAAIMAPFVLLPFLPIRSQHEMLLARRVYGAYRAVFDRAPGLDGVLLMTLAVGIGTVLSRLIREVKLLLPIAVVLALVDLYVVFGGGLVSQANSGKAPAAQIAMRSLTVPLTPRMPKRLHAPPPVAVGFADFLFIALFFACFARFSMPARGTFLLLCGVLSVYMLAVIAARIDLPALVPIAAVVIGNNLRAFRYQREEAFALLYAGILVVGVLSALVFLGRR